MKIWILFITETSHGFADVAFEQSYKFSTHVKDRSTTLQWP